MSIDELKNLGEEYVHPSGEKKWWIPMGFTSWAPLFSLNKNLKASTYHSFEFEKEHAEILKNGTSALEKALSSFISPLTITENEAHLQQNSTRIYKSHVVFVGLDTRHASYLMCNLIVKENKVVIHNVIRFDTHGSYRSETSELFDKCFYCVAKRLKFHYRPYVSYWKSQFHLGQRLPGSGLCMSLPFLFMSWYTSKNVHLQNLSDYAKNVAESELLQELIRFAKNNVLLDELISVFEPVYSAEEVYSVERRALDQIYSTILLYCQEKL
jgi:hypothetical protein